MTINPETVKPNHQIPFLDGIRGLLAIWVLCSHVINLGGGPDIFLRKGGIAVDLFMFVSGVLMVTTYSRVQDPSSCLYRKNIISFWIKRFFRIAPAYFFLLIPGMLYDAQLNGMLLSVKAEFGRVGTIVPEVWASYRGFSFENLLVHLTFLFGLIPRYASSDILPDWSLSLEMQFYFVFPFLLYALRRFGALWVGLPLMLVYILFVLNVAVFTPRYGAWIFYPQPTLLPVKIACFFLGMLAAEACMPWTSARTRRVIVLVFFAGVFVFQRPTFSMAAIAMLAMLMSHYQLLGWKYISVVNKFFGSAPLKFLGDISYGVYLIHLLVLLPVFYWVVKSGIAIPSSTWIRFSLGLFVVAIPAIFLAWMLHNLIELPGVSLGKNLSNRYKRSMEIKSIELKV